MSFKSSSKQYGAVAVTIHWVSALLIFVLLGSGFKAGNAEASTAKIDVLQVHISIGIAILLLTLARIAWWIFADKKPDPLEMGKWQDRGARAVHYMFYVVILGMVASGIGMIVLSGAAPIIFDGSNTTLPDFWDYLPRIPHGIGARLIILLLVLHAGAALYHHFFKKDGLLHRMWYKKST